MKMAKISGFLVILAATPVALANGGGYFRGGIESTGNIAGFEPQGTGNIRILDEKLTVRLGSGSAGVEVRYLMRNETDKKVKIRFGFPVEELFDRDLMGESPEGEKPASTQGKSLQYCRDYAITAGVEEVRAKWTPEPKPSTDKRFRGVAGWLVSELTFAAHEEKPVLICFRSFYPSEEWSVSDNESLTAARFTYRLSTAACWAGTIGEGVIIFIPDGIPADEIRVIKPVNRFAKEGDNWVWRFKDLEPTLADDLEIEAVPAIHSYPVSYDRPEDEYFSSYVDRGGKWSMKHTNFSIQASSTLAPDGDIRYDADNVRDYEAATIWSEGAPGPGKNEWLEMTPKVAKPLRAIEIAPGCWRTPELFRANARPRKILVELNGSHRFHTEVPDRMEDFTIPIAGYSKDVSKIRLTFEDVWPGTKYEDLCISSIRLHVRLDRKPKLPACR